MTKTLLKFVLTGLLYATGLASAQNIRVDIPFQFHVGAEQMPAGTYVIRPAGSLSERNELRIRELNGNNDKFFTGNAVQSTGRLQTDKLVFACYEKQCFLLQVWKASDGGGVQLARTKFEKDLIAARKAPSQVVLAAR